MADQDDPTGSLPKIRAQLLSEFGATLGTDAVDAALATYRAEFASARVTTFVPMLIERACREQLRRQLVHG